MKKSGVVLLSLLFLPLMVLAQGSIYKSGSLVQVQEADSIQKQLITAGQTVEMSGWLGNDFLSAGRFMMLKGTVSDDAIMAAQQVIIDGEVGDLLMSAGETIIVNGLVKGDAFLAAREIRITE